MKISRIVSSLLESNVYILEKDDEVIIVDCGAEVGEVAKLVGDKKVVGILLTHGHYDHCFHCNEYAEKFNAKIYASEKVKFTMTDKEAIYSEDGSTIDDFSHFEFLNEDCNFQIGGFNISAYACGGHCKCCECYLIDGNLFAGDVLFERSIGRTDLKGSSKEEMLASLNKLEKVEFEKVYSGHGESTSRGEQMKNIAVYKRFLSR